VAREVDLKTGRLNAVELSGGAIANPLRFEVGYNGAVQSSLKYPSGSGLESSWEYDRGRLARVAIEKGGQPVGGAEFKRNSIGQVTQIIELNGLSGLGKAFKYVGERLTAAKEVSQFGATYERTQGQNESTISYDGTNPQQRKRVTPRNGTPIDYVVDGTGRYLSIGGLVPQYDTLGRVTSLGDYTYRYEGTNLNPVEVQRLGVVVRKFGYDLHGNLIRTTDSSGRTTEYLKSGTVDIGELDAATGELVKAFVTFPNGQTPREKIASVDLETGVATYFTHTGPFTPFAAHDAQGNIQERYDTRFAEGRLSIAAPNGAVRQSSAVGREDGFHGLHHFSDAGPFGGISITPARTLVPAIGFFLAPDPLGTTAQKYTYADNNPVTRADPTGLQAEGGDQKGFFDLWLTSVKIGLPYYSPSAASACRLLVGDEAFKESDEFSQGLVDGFWGAAVDLFSLAADNVALRPLWDADALKRNHSRVVALVETAAATVEETLFVQIVIRAQGIDPDRFPQTYQVDMQDPVTGEWRSISVPRDGIVTALAKMTLRGDPKEWGTFAGAAVFDSATGKLVPCSRLVGTPKPPRLSVVTPAREAAKTGAATGAAQGLKDVATSTTVKVCDDCVNPWTADLADSYGAQELTDLMNAGVSRSPRVQHPRCVLCTDENPKRLISWIPQMAERFRRTYGAAPQPRDLGGLIADIRAGRIPVPEGALSGVYVFLTDGRGGGRMVLQLGDPKVAKHVLTAGTCLPKVIAAGEFRIGPSVNFGRFDNASGTFMEPLVLQEQAARMQLLSRYLEEVAPRFGLSAGDLVINMLSF